MDKNFAVSLFRRRIELAGHFVYDGPFEWIKVIPYKILCFLWRAKQGRIPSAVALHNRGITIPSVICGSCNRDEETSEHLLISCSLAKTVMDEILKWCEIRCDSFKSVGDMLLFISCWSKNKRKRSMLNTILCGVLWCIWIDRNNRVFNNTPFVLTKTVERVKSVTFIWCKHRGSYRSVGWRILNRGLFLCL